MGEEWSLLLQAFVTNDPVNHYDPDGLRTGGSGQLTEACNCGPDNTQGLKDALLDAELRFLSAGAGGEWSRWWAQIKGCVVMFFTPKGTDAWGSQFHTQD